MSKSGLVLGVKQRKMPNLAQLRYINSFLEGSERLMVGISALLFVIATVFLGVYAYVDNTVALPQNGGEYKEALVGYPQYINPVLSQTNDVDLDLSSLMFSGLFKRTTDQRLAMDLVSDYSISDDQKTYTFFLRRDVTFHDGNPLTADDVIFTVQAIQDPNYQSPLEPSLRGVVATKVDDYTLTLALKEPFSPFLTSLTFGILPQHIWANVNRGSTQNITLSEYNIRPIGSGPFMFERLVKDNTGVLKTYSVVPYDGYYDKKPYLQRLVFAFYPDVYLAGEALDKGQVEGLAFITAEQRKALPERKLDFRRLQLPQYTAIFFNIDDSPVLDDDEVRQALVWGVDRERIINEALDGEGEPAYTPILPGYIGHNADVEKYGFDIEKGKQILDDDGWALLEGEEFRKKGERVLEFSIATVNQPEFAATLNVLVENWTKMGIKVNVNSYEPADIQDQIIKPRDYEALVFGQIVGLDPDPYAFWHSSQMQHPGLALSVFFQKNIDDLLEAARKTSDEEERRLSYFNFQNILAEELPALFLYNPYYTYAIRKDVKGVDTQDITTPADRFANITEWYVKTDRVFSWNAPQQESQVADQSAESQDTQSDTEQESTLAEDENTEASTDEAAAEESL